MVAKLPALGEFRHAVHPFNLDLVEEGEALGFIQDELETHAVEEMVYLVLVGAEDLPVLLVLAVDGLFEKSVFTKSNGVNSVFICRIERGEPAILWVSGQVR